MINRRDAPLSKPGVTAGFIILLVLLSSCNLPGRLSSATPTLLPSPTLLPVLDTPTQLPPIATPTASSTPTTAATPTKAPVNIAFSTGTTAAVEEGTIQPAQIQAYTLSARQNQPMILLLTSSNKGVYLGVTGPNGKTLLDPVQKWTSWQWLLPETGVYTIRVYAGSTAETYTLTAKVAQRITFASGASSATLNGSTPNGFVFSYAIFCNANQVMNLSLNVPASKAYLDVFGLATGSILSSSSKVNTWTGTLPAAQDYIIEVIPVGGQVVQYTLTVTVQ